MATTTQVAGTSGSLLSSVDLADEMAGIYSNFFGNMYLSPKIMRFIVRKECHGKAIDETYRQYMERLRGSPFSNKEWKDAFRISRNVLQTDRNPDNLDVTDLFCLLENLFARAADNGTRDITGMMNKLRVVKDLRNEVMHNMAATADPQKFSDLTTALLELVRETELFYSLPQAEVEALEKELQDDIDRRLAPEKQVIYYTCSRLATSGKNAVRILWETRLSSEVLMFSNEKVHRQAVFHPLELMLKLGASGNVIPYTEIFQVCEKFIVISGVAGAGKTTLLKNITLQFFELQQVKVKYLQPFNQLILFECRDRSTKTLSEVIEHHFEDLCSNIRKENVLRALLHLDVIFLIDGFDEINKVSSNVVMEIIKKTWRSNCRVVITTRPHFVKQLALILSKNDICHTECEILPLIKLENQLKFLERYEEYHGGSNRSGELCRSFSLLDKNVRSLFTEPLNLLLFCHLCRHFPEKIPLWQTFADVASDIFLLYKTLVLTKIVDSNYINLEGLVDDQFLCIGAAALDFLKSNTLSFSEEEFRSIKKMCNFQLKSAEGISDIDAEIFLSVVLKVHRPFSGKGGITYTFHHKSVQEIFAGKYIVQRILSCNDSINSILGLTSIKRNW
ncbi:uncharacterized protein LOC108678211 [Hyalella azteca]|uniref:Uncharacterized protein LOC108678211 n=1 Tax=Hyalella azteca TaxID=294128 RepID=A0A8B7P8C6_HYAAZ|nr:uncharacterized protein LOC108678211 [Hyalella azteca]XP_047736282.1 uncharacterized protein LOC108678211 [Hyalella azteca]